MRKHLVSLAVFTLAFAVGFGLWLAVGDHAAPAAAYQAPKVYVGNSATSTANIVGCAWRLHNMPPFVIVDPFTPIAPGGIGVEPIEVHDHDAAAGETHIGARARGEPRGDRGGVDGGVAVTVGALERHLGPAQWEYRPAATRVLQCRFEGREIVSHGTSPCAFEHNALGLGGLGRHSYPSASSPPVTAGGFFFAPPLFAAAAGRVPSRQAPVPSSVPTPLPVRCSVPHY